MFVYHHSTLGLTLNISGHYLLTDLPSTYNIPVSIRAAAPIIDIANVLSAVDMRDARANIEPIMMKAVP